jgi:hypothetical protein
MAGFQHALPELTVTQTGKNGEGQIGDLREEGQQLMLQTLTVEVRPNND